MGFGPLNIKELDIKHPNPLAVEHLLYNEKYTFWIFKMFCYIKLVGNFDFWVNKKQQQKKS